MSNLQVTFRSPAHHRRSPGAPAKVPGSNDMACRLQAPAEDVGHTGAEGRVGHTGTHRESGAQPARRGEREWGDLNSRGNNVRRVCNGNRVGQAMW